MNILMIETTGAKASAAVVNESGKISQAYSDETLNHLSFLMPLIDEALRKANLKAEELDLIAASQGPGSFTGIRIGVSSARALAQALNLPCMAVPTLKTFLYNLEECDEEELKKYLGINMKIPKKNTAEPDFTSKYEGTVFCPLFDARRSQVYGGAYAWKKDLRGSDEIYELAEGKAYSLDEILSILSLRIALGSEKDKEEAEALSIENAGAANKFDEKINRIIFFGDGINSYSGQIEAWKEKQLKNTEIEVIFAQESERYQNAVSGLKLAMRLYKPENVCCYNKLEPNYMRKAEAQRKLEEAKMKEKKD